MNVKPALQGLLADLTRHPVISASIGALLVAAAAVAPWDGALSALVVEQRQAIGRSLEIPRLLGVGQGMVLLAILLGASGRRRTAVHILVTLLLVLAITWVLKVGIGRVRPNGSPLAFPSGDSAPAAAMIVPLMLLSRWTLLLTVPAATAAALRRVVYQYHWPSDILAGLAVGLLASLLARRLIWPRYFPPRWAWLGLAIFASVGGSLGMIGEVEDVWQFLEAYGPGLGALIAAGWLPALLRSRSAASLPPEAELASNPGVERVVVPPRAVAAILAAGGTVLLGLTFASTLFDRDEGYYAQVAWEMVQSGAATDWLVPHYNGEPFYHKPPLHFWLMAASGALLGKGEWAFRLPSVLASVAAMWLTWRLARRLAGREAGLWSMLALIACPMGLLTGPMAILDPLLMALIAGAICVFVDDVLDEVRWWRTLALGALMGLSALVKGPVGPAVVGLATLGSWVFLRRRARLGWGYLARLAVASIVCAGVFAAWFVPANAVSNGEFVDVFVGEHILRRATEPMENHGVGRLLAVPFYAAVIFAGFSPWTMLLPAAASALAAGRLATREARVVTLCWAIPTFAAFCAVATTLPHYILPLWPALAVLAGATVAAAGSMAERDRRWLRRGARADVVLLWLPAAGLLASPAILWLAGRIGPYPYFDRLQEGAFAMGLVLLAMAVGTRGMDPARHLRTRFAVMSAGMVAIAIAAGAVLVPDLEVYKAPPVVARRVDELLGTDMPLDAVGFREPSLLFYLDRTPVGHVTDRTLDAWADRPGPAGLIIPRDELGFFGYEDPCAVPAERLGSAQGLNLSTGRWLDVQIYRRIGGDPDLADANTQSNVSRDP